MQPKLQAAVNYFIFLLFTVLIGINITWAQVPTITSFSPISAKPGDVVTITGTSFNTTAINNIVFFGATRATVTAATSTQLTVTVPSGATYAPITVINSGTQLARAGVNNFNPIYSPAKTGISTTDLQSEVNFISGNSPIGLAIGDLDADGKPDMVSVNGSSRSISIYRNIGSVGSITTSSFAAKVDISTGITSTPTLVTIGDLDADGKPDLVIGSSSLNTLNVFRNTSTSGSISFAAKADFSTGSFTSPYQIAIGDIDGDGKPDLVAANSNNGVAVFRNTSTSGSISLAAKVDFSTGSSSSPVSVAIGDIDGDGKADVVTSNNGSNSVSVFRNISSIGTITTSSFENKVDFTTGTAPYYVAIGDVDGDGRNDLIVPNNGSSTLSVFRNTSTSGSITTSSFAPKIDLTTGTAPIQVAVGDIDGDGKPDLVATNNSGNTFSIFRNISTSGTITTSSFSAKVDVTTASNPFGVAIGDLDGDSRPDIAVANLSSATVSVFRNAPPPPPTITSFTPNSGSVGSLVTITGTNLSNPTGLTIGGAAALPISNSGTELVAMVMPGATTGVVSVTTSSGTTNISTNFTVNPSQAPNTQQGNKLVGTGNTGAALQGWSVDVSADGNTAIVGGLNDNSGLGAAWIFVRSGNTWTQQGNKLVGTGAIGSFVQQGIKVAISADGNTAVVGGNFDNNSRGAAWIFVRTGTTWSQQGNKLVGSGTVGSTTYQGRAVDISADGNTVIVGGYGDNSNQGAVWVFTRSGTTWSQQGSKLVGTGNTGAAQQGLSVAISADGNTILVGGWADNSLQGAAWVFTRSGTTWTQQGNKLVGTGNTGAAQQGISVAISADGNTALIGGAGDNTNIGAAWIFTRSGTTWSQQGNKLVGTGNVGAAYQANFVSISADGNIAALGSVLDNSNQGATWVFVRNGSTWSQQGNKLIGTGSIGSFVQQGYSPAISADGNTLLVGGAADNSNQGGFWSYNYVQPPPPTITNFSPSSGSIGSLVTITGTTLNNLSSVTIGGVSAIPISNDGTTLVAMVMPGATTGIVSVTTNFGIANSSGSFTITTTLPPNTQMGSKLTSTGATGSAIFGFSLDVSADGSTALVGGPSDNSGVGAVWVFTRSGSTWTQQGNKLVGTGNVGGSQQGSSVKLSADGNTAVVGGSDDNGGIGAIWIFTRTGTTWSQQGSKLVGTGSVGTPRQGASVAISADGNTVVVGGRFDNSFQGAVWIFTRSGTTWAQQGSKILGTGNVGAARQGQSVALSADGNTLIFGASNDNSNIGAAWIFVRNGSTWTQQGNKLVGTGNVGASIQGMAVAISADGNTAMVGGPSDNNVLGAAWIFVRNGSTWSQQGNKLVGTGNVGTSEQGMYLSLTADGNTAVLGAVTDNNSQGAVWIFTRTGTTWSQHGNKIIGTGSVGSAAQGYSPAISADGSILLVGGPLDNSNVGAFWSYNYVFIPAPTITSFNPTSGTVGSLVTITGTNLNNPTALTIGGAAAIPISNSSTQLVAMVMPGATTGLVNVTTGGGAINSVSNFNTVASNIPNSQQGNKFTGNGNVGTSQQGFAIDVSADGNTAIVGGFTDNGGTGAAWIFTRTGSTWSQEGTKLVGTNSVGGPRQGYSVAISADGNTAAVGGYFDNSLQGAIWVFTRNGTTWTQQGNKLVGTGNTGTAQQGTAVAISANGNTIAVGGSTDNTNQGAVWVFTRSGTTWSQQGNKLVGSGNTGAAQQGRSVAISADGNTLISGGNTDNSNRGAAWVFVRSGTVWNQQGSKLTGTNNISAEFGTSIDISADGNTAIIGGPREGVGATWVFTRTGTTWSQQGNKLEGTGVIANSAAQGTSVSLSADGNMAVIGGRSDNNGVGAFWTFNRTGTTWAQQAKVAPIGNVGTSNMGSAVALAADGNTIIAGGNGDNSFIGAVWPFTFTQPISISSFTPSNAKPGDEVIITGTSFNTTTLNNIVFFGATRATVTAATATQLTVTVPAGATFAPISVLNTATGTRTNSLNNFIPVFAPPNVGNITHNAKVDFGVLNVPFSISASDFDGDGKIDLVASNGNSSSIAFYRNTGSNGVVSFSSPLPITSGTFPAGIAVGDIDGDGKLDVAVANQSSFTVSIFRNTSTIGTISFANKVDVSVGATPLSVALADLDGDGKLDIAVPNSGGNSLSILQNHSTSGVILFPSLRFFATATAPRNITTSDIDGDGKLDVVVTNASSNSLSVFRNTSTLGAIALSAKVDFTTGNTPNGLAVGDIDGDGKPDIAVTNQDANTISIFRNTAVTGTINNSSFATKLDFTTGTTPRSLTLSDVDADGKVDVTVANFNNNNASVFLNTSSSGAVSLANKIDFATANSPAWVTSVDIDGNGRPDIITTNQTGTANTAISVLLNETIPPPAITSISPTSGSVGSLVTITGSNLSNQTALTIGGVAAIPISNNGNTIVAMVMPGATTGVVSVTTIGGTGNSIGNFTIATIPALNTQQGNKLVGTNNTGTASQGWSVAISADGNTAVLGGLNDNGGQGAAWVFVRTGNTWSQQGNKLVGTGNVGNATQGYSVGISADGNTVIVGGPQDNNQNGAAWVFVRNGTTWSQQGNKLVGTGGIANPSQGNSVALSADGNTAIVGGWFDNSSVGAVWVFTRSGTTWSQQGNKLVGTGSVGSPRQGQSLALSANGNTAIVGGAQDNNFNGAAWVFSRSGTTWTQQGSKLVGSGNIGSAGQGRSVAISADGNTALVGGNGDNNSQGAIWIYTRTGSSWAQQGGKIVGTGSIGASPQQGYSASLSADGNTAIVGGYVDNGNQGAAWVFTRNGTTWEQQGSKLVGTGNVGAARQGISLALSADGNTALVGGSFDNSNQGAAWVFVYSPPPSITVTSTLTTFSSCIGVASAEQSFTVSGSNLTNDITITAPTGFEVSTTSGSGFDGSVTVTQSGGSVAVTTVYIRLSATASDSPTGNITVASTGVTTQNIAVSGTVALPPTITSISPSAGPIGTLVTIAGTNFNNLSTVNIGGVSAIIVNSTATQIVAMVMPAATTGIASVTTNCGTGNSTANFTVTAPNTPSLQQGNKLVGTGSGGSTPQQGYSVAISADGNTAIVGGNQDNNFQGAVWIYTRTGSTWTQQGNKLVGTGAVGNAFQGWSVALSADGNTALVGGYVDNSSIGAAWVFTRTGTTWTQQGNKLVGTGNVGNASQGYSVALSADGNTALMGGLNDNGNQGAAWVFTRSGTTWTQQGNKLVGTGNTGNAFQGISVALSADGNTAMVGGYNDNGGQGAVWVFTRTGTTWAQQGNKLVATGNTGAAGIGRSVALSADGNTAIVGADTDNSSIGAAWVFSRAGTTWTQQGNKLVGTGGVGSVNSQGRTVSISADGNTAIVGGSTDNNNQGATWVFRRTNTSWAQQGNKLVGTGNIGFAYQGAAVALSADGNTAVVGGFADNSQLGAAWVFVGQTGPIVSANLTAFNTCAGTVSAEQSFTVSGNSLTNNITITAPTGFEISTTSGGSFTSSITLTQVSGNVAATLVYVRLASNATGSPTGNITIATSGYTTQNIAVSGTVNALPSITLGSVTSIRTTANSFSLPFTNTTGSPNQYSIVTGSPTSMPNFVAVNNATLSTSPITVSIPASVQNNYNFTLRVTNTTTGCISANNNFTVQVADATISTTGSLNNFNSCAGSTSASQSFSTSGINLQNNIVITAPSGFEISTTSTGTYTNSITLTQVSGVVNATNIFVRIAANAIGTPSGNISLVSAGATTQNIAVTGVVNALPNPVINTSGSTTICAGSSVELSVQGTAAGNAISLRGNDERLQLPSISNVRAFSVWVNIPSTQQGPFRYLVDARDGLGSGWANSDDGISGAWSKLYINGISQTVAWNSIPKNQWVHVYLEANSNFTDDITFFGRFGMTSQGIYESLIVRVDELAIWSTPKTNAEIQALMGSPISNTASGLLAYYNFNQSSGLTVADQSGNGRNATIINGSVWVSSLLPFYSSYVWSSGGATTSILNASNQGSYSVTVTDFNGCVGTSSTPVVVTVNPLPSISLSPVSTVSTIATSFIVPFASTSGSPNQYSITTGTPTAMPSFASVTNQTLGSSPISVTIPASSAGTYNFNLTTSNSITGCVSTNNPFTVQVVNASISTSGTLNNFSSCNGSASTPQSFSVSGSNLLNNLVITAPTGFELSTSSNGTYSNTLTLTPESGSVVSTNIFVRIAVNATGTPSGNITLASIGATTRNVAIVGTVNALPISSITGSTSVCIGTTTILSPISGGVWSSSNTSVATVSNAGIVTGVAAGTATFVFTNTATGCSSVATPAVTVNSLPTVSITGAAAICVGSTTTLSPTSGGTWSSSNILVARVSDAGVVTGVSSGTATFVFTSTTTGCASAATPAVTVNSLPTVSITGVSSICIGTTTALTPTSGGVWSSDNTSVATVSNTGIVSGVAAGTATFVFTSTTTGCVSAATPAITVNNNPTISVGVINNINSAATSYVVPFTAVTNNPDQYSITTGIPSLSGFTALNNVSLSSSPITITIPRSRAGIYNFNVTVRNSTTGCISAAVPFTITVTQAPPQKWYVKTASSGLGDGSSWNNASSDLQGIINGASKLDTIWVAGGTYLPTRDVNGNTAIGAPRTRTFFLKDSVMLYGGFNGNETTLNQRNITTNATILSGDLNNNDGANFANYDDNVYHVVFAFRLSAATIVDGFTIRGGNATNGGDFSFSNYPIFSSSGGGMYNVYGNNIFSNLTFTLNRCTSDGGAIINASDDFNPSNIAFNNCAFTNNTSGNYSGAVYSYKVTATFNNNVFRANNSGFLGGATFHFYGNSTYNSCIFFQNRSNNFGGAVSHRIGSLRLFNCVIANNTAVQGGGAIYGVIENRETRGQIINSTIFGNTTTGTNSSSNGFAMVGEQFTITNSIFWNNTGNFSGGAEISAAGNGIDVNNSVVVKGNSTFTSSQNNNVSANPNFVNTSNLIGNDGIWGTSDDGLNLSCGSSAFGIADNNPRPTDIIGTTRPQFTTASAGAYEPTTVLLVPAPTGSATQNFITSNPTIADLQTTSGVNIKWYASATSTTALASSTPLVNGSRYYATQTPAGICGESTSRLEVLVSFGPSIIVNGNLSAFSSCGGSASSHQSLMVSGSNLTADVVVTAPTGFEVSTSATTGYASSISLVPLNNIVAATTIYVRVAAIATGNLAGNITIATSNASPNLIAVSGAVTTINNQTVSANPAIVCSNNSSIISLASTEVGINYTLRNNANNAIVAGPITGTGSAITFNTGNITATTTYNVLAQTSVAGSLEFDGVDDYVSIPNDAAFNTSTYTVEGWIFPTGGAQYKWVFGKRTPSDGWNLYIADDRLELWNGFNAVIAGPSIPFNTWSHVAITGSTSGQKMYLNGILVGSSTTVAIPPDPSSPFTIGTNSDAFGPWFFGGKMDEVRVWNVERSASNILNSINTTFAGTETGLIGLYTFSDGTGSTTLTDAAGGNNNGTLVNMNVNTAWVSGRVSAGTLACNLQLANTVTVTVNPLPTPTITANGSTTLCQGGSVTLTASAGSTYLWSTGAATQSITVSTAGSYTVTVTNANGCSATSSATVVVVNALPTINLGSVATILNNVASFSLPYTSTTGNANGYSITTGTPGAMPGFTPITNAALSSSPLTVPIPINSNAGTYNFNLTVTNSTTGCVSTNNTFTVTLLPAINITTAGTLTAVNTTYGTASATTSFAVSAIGLTDNLIIAAPTGFQVSTNATSGYASSITITPNSGTVASTTIFVRLAATTTVGTYSGNILCSSTGATTQNVATVSSTVTPAALTITASNANKVYGAVATLSNYTTNGLVNGDAITTVSLTSTGSPATANVGTYNIVPSSATGTGLSNYNISYTDGTLTVTPAVLTITASNANKVYSTVANLGSTAFTATGLINGNTVTAVSLSSTGSPASANVGTYPIVASAAVGTGLSNYSISYTDGTLTVTQAALVITANNTSKVYGIVANLGSTAFTATGLVNGNTVTAVTLSSAGSPATANVGTYNIVPSGATGTGLSNYNISYTDGTLTVTPATLTITASNQVKCQGVTFTIGNTQFTAVGLVNGNTVTAVTLSSIGSAIGTAAGNYSIIPSNAVGTGLINYNIVYVNGQFTVNPLPNFTVIAPSNFICGATASLTLTASGGATYQWFRNNTLISGANSATFTATQAGSYTATATTAQGCTATSSNALSITQLVQPVANFSFDSYCTNRAINFSNQSTVNNSGAVSYAWSDNVGNRLTTTNASVTYTAANTYSMQLRVQSIACPTLADSITRVIPVESPRAATRLATVDVALGDNTSLQARTFGTQYTWTPSIGISNPFISNPTVSLNSEQDYRITIRVPSGCVTVDSILVRVQEANTVFVPNVFSPNGDGNNDRLLIIPVGIRELKYFRIFNRNGKKLFETANINAGWDGTFNGQLQPLETYVWNVLAIDKYGNTVYKEGTVTLLR